MNKITTISDWRAIPADANESVWKTEDGWPVRRIDFAPKSGIRRRGAMLFLPGRGDHYEKYIETLDYWAGEGWQVTSIDWRGQGGSGRLLDDPYTGHIDDFSTWISDLAYFWKSWKAGCEGPHVVVAHSMGGHLVMRALEEKVIDPQAAAMSAPMLGIRENGLPLWLTHAFARAMVKLGRGERPAWKVSEKPMSPLNLRQKILTNDKRRYEDELAWWEIRPEVKLGPASFHWVERAIASTRQLEAPGRLEAVTTPILLLATDADQLVSTRRIKRDATRLPNAKLVVFGKEAAHELLREADPVRDKCLAEITAFFDSHAIAK